MRLRDHTFLGMTQSLCPQCLALVPAKIVVKDGRVYFRTHCPAHGVREDFICSDVSQYDRMEYGCGQAIDLVMINSNGLRFAHDPAFLEAVARFRHRLEVYLQFDGFTPAASTHLRGEDLVETKLRAVEALGKHGVRVILVAT